MGEFSSPSHPPPLSCAARQEGVGLVVGAGRSEKHEGMTEVKKDICGVVEISFKNTLDTTENETQTLIGLRISAIIIDQL